MSFGGKFEILKAILVCCWDETNIVYYLYLFAQTVPSNKMVHHDENYIILRFAVKMSLNWLKLA